MGSVDTAGKVVSIIETDRRTLDGDLLHEACGDRKCNIEFRRMSQIRFTEMSQKILNTYAVS